MMDSEEHLSIFYQRLFWPSKRSHFILILLCIHICLAICGPFAMRNLRLSEMDQILDPLDYDGCGSYGDSYDIGVRDFLAGKVSSKHGQLSSPTFSGLMTICTNSELFCFPSTLPGFFAKEDNVKANPVEAFGGHDDAALLEESLLRDTSDGNSSSLTDPGTFVLFNGRTVSCSFNSTMQLNFVLSTERDNAVHRGCSSFVGSSLKHQMPCSIPDENSEVKVIKPDLHGFSSPNVEISPPFIDWGQNYLYVPSSASITVANTCNESILHIYRPFSTDTQFYPCSSGGDVLLKPGEVASICFIFLPRQLGLLSAHLVLQTSSGGFLVHAEGLAIESLYGIQPLVGLDISSHGSWKKNLSLHNPFDDTIYVKEIAIWMSDALGNTSHYAEAICKMDSFQDSTKFTSYLNGKDWLYINSDQADLPLMAIRLHRSWEIDPQSSETIIEMNFLTDAEGQVFGAFCLQLQSSSLDRNDIILVPLEAEIHGQAVSGGLAGLVSVFLEPIVPCDGSKQMAVLLSLRNGAPYLLSVQRISEVTDDKKFFHIKYVDGLLLFPGTVTEVALVTYASGNSGEPSDDMFNIDFSCKMLILTNDSGSPQIEIPCQDVIGTCSRHQSDSYVGSRLQQVMTESGNTITRSLGSIIKSPSLSSYIKKNALEFGDVDELVLRNWKSQGTSNFMSVVDDEEVLFPSVRIGSYCSKWITVKNPSQQPVVMQLILNSAAVVDGCRTTDKSFQQPLPRILVQNESSGPVGYGFSLPETAVTEAYVHPYGKALFGPIVFHPSRRCGWSSSVLIRNNLSGVEWLRLRGFGGLLSMVLLEGSELVRSLEFNFNMPTSLNISPPEIPFHVEEANTACSKPLSKEVYAKNSGDLPLEVKKIVVSGADCGLDGFLVHTCKAFFLEPGESRRLLISYRTDFSAAVVHRDLELALATGKFVIPMKASLPVYMLNLCKKSFFWTLLKKLSLVVLIAFSVTFVVFCCVLPHVMAMGSQEFLFKSENVTISRARKPSCVLSNNRNSKFSYYNKTDGIYGAVREDETTKLSFVGRYADCPTEAEEQRMTDQHMKLMQDVQDRDTSMSTPKNVTPLLQYTSDVNSVALETPPCTGKLSVKITKEKGKKRRKRRSSGSCGSPGIAGSLEISSSQSGNSTPSSPLSPVTSFVSKRTWPLSPDIELSVEGRRSHINLANQHHIKERVIEAASEPKFMEHNLSAKYESSSCLSTQSQSPVPRKASSKPILLPSATFPCASRRFPGVVSPSPFSASTSATPHARAPGSNLCKEKTIKAEENASPVDKFTYDIWGSHFSGFDLSGKIQEFSSAIDNVSEEDSQSFFVKGPQILMQKSEARSVSPGPVLPPCAVTSLHQNG